MSFAVNFEWVTDDKFWIIMFCLCFVLANNRLLGTSERTCCCFRESERHAIAVLSDLNYITSNLWWSMCKTRSWR